MQWFHVYTATRKQEMGVGVAKRVGKGRREGGREEGRGGERERERERESRVGQGRDKRLQMYSLLLRLGSTNYVEVHYFIR